MKGKINHIIEIIKKNKITSIVLTLILLISIISISFAAFFIEKEGSEKNITLSNLDITYIDGQMIKTTNTYR